MYINYSFIIVVVLMLLIKIYLFCDGENPALGRTRLWTGIYSSVAVFRGAFSHRLMDTASTSLEIHQLSHFC